MNQEMQNQLAGIISDARNAGKSAYEFLISQAPELADQIVAWAVWSNSISALIFFLCVIFYAIGCRWTYKNWETIERKYLEPGGVCFFTIGGFVSVICLAFAICRLSIALKAIIAPKLYLIEYLANLVK